MITSIHLENWTPFQIWNWLEGICDESGWIDERVIMESQLTGRDLLLLTPECLMKLGITRVSYQELILEAIENLKFYCHCLTQDTLQTLLLRLACQSRSLQYQLSHSPGATRAKDTAYSNDLIEHNKDTNRPTEQRISLGTLASVSAIVELVKEVTSRLNRIPFCNQDEYRSMKSLLLALSVELTSTAQRDQFVVRPNDIIEKSSKALADYCDTMVSLTRDPLLIETCYLESVVIEKGPSECEGLVIKSNVNSNRHFIDEILPLSPAKKTNKLSEGDEIILFNQLIIGWSAKKVQKLIEECSRLREIVLIVIKTPRE